MRSELARHKTARMPLLYAVILFCVLVSANFFIGYTKVEPAAAAGSTYYVDPVNGSDANPGTSALPWKSIKTSSIVSGDTVLLRAGNYGDLTLSNKSFTSTVTIAAENEAARPIFTNILVINCNNLKLDTLNVYGGAVRRTARTQYEQRFNMLCCNGDNIEVANCWVSSTSISDSTPAQSWTASDWNTKSASGIQVWGDNAYIHDNLLVNVFYGIEFMGDTCLIERNQIINFCGDGISLKGMYNEVARNNRIVNHYQTDPAELDHADMIQVYWDEDTTHNTPIYGLVLEGNFCADHDSTFVNLAFANRCQGIGSFDNNMVDGLIINNVVLVHDWCGIAALGGVGTKIINNTVFDPYAYSKWHGPTIEIHEAQNGENSKNIVARNNICDQIVTEGTADNPIIDHNITSPNASAVFSNHSALDMTLREGSPAIDAGSSLLAPAEDIAGNTRPQGTAWDIGAYEYGTVAPPPPPVTYTITASASPAAGGTISGAGTYEEGETVTLRATANSGYDFVNWSEDGSAISSSASYSFTAAADRTLVANFEEEPPPPPPDTYTITATAGPGGSISPSGAVVVEAGASQSFTIAPYPGYSIAGVKVDGASVGAVSTVTFTDVSADHSVAATFELIPVEPTTYTITATAGPGGSISPSGEVAVEAGASQSFTIAPDPGYSITGVKVDGASVGAVSTVTFTDVSADHSVAATFELFTYKVITMVSGSGGEITPKSRIVTYGGTATINITPYKGYYIASITDNGEKVPVSKKYVIKNVTTRHEVVVAFASVRDLSVKIRGKAKAVHGVSSFGLPLGAPFLKAVKAQLNAGVFSANELLKFPAVVSSAGILRVLRRW